MSGSNQKKKQYVSVEDAAVKWGVTPETVRKYCRSGKIKNAIKKDGRWYISTEEIKPLTQNEIKRLIKLSLLNNVYHCDLKKYSLNSHKNNAIDFYLAKYNYTRNIISGNSEATAKELLSNTGKKLVSSFKKISASQILDLVTKSLPVIQMIVKWYLENK